MYDVSMYSAPIKEALKMFVNNIRSHVCTGVILIDEELNIYLNIQLSM